MQMSLKRCKHFELGGEKKTKGAALTFVRSQPILLFAYADPFFSKRPVYYSIVSPRCMTLLLYYCPCRFVRILRCWKLAMHMNTKNHLCIELRIDFRTDIDSQKFPDFFL